MMQNRLPLQTSLSNYLELLYFVLDEVLCSDIWLCLMIIGYGCIDVVARIPIGDG
jgi:hypothetical protein